MSSIVSPSASAISRATIAGSTAWQSVSVEVTRTTPASGARAAVTARSTPSASACIAIIAAITRPRRGATR